MSMSSMIGERKTHTSHILATTTGPVIWRGHQPLDTSEHCTWDGFLTQLASSTTGCLYITNKIKFIPFSPTANKPCCKWYRAFTINDERANQDDIKYLSRWQCTGVNFRQTSKPVRITSRQVATLMSSVVLIWWRWWWLWSLAPEWVIPSLLRSVTQLLPDKWDAAH